MSSKDFNKKEISDDTFLEFTEKIIQEKTKGNEKYKNLQLSEAERHYKNAIESSEEFFKKISEKEKELLEKGNPFYEKFSKELKNSYSNLAAVYLRQGKNKDLIEIDKFILTELDQNFDKSFARIILAYHRLDDNENAINYYLLMKNKFNRETMAKYEEQLKPIDTLAKRKIERMKKMHKKEDTWNISATNTGLLGSWRNKIIYSLLITLIFFIYFIYSNGGLTKDTDINPSNKTNNNKNFDEVNLDNIKDEDLALNLTPEAEEENENKP